LDQKELEAARSRKERIRLQLFGYVRDKDGEIVEPQPTQVEAAIRDSLGFAASESNSDDRIEAMRERLFGYRRDPTGKILGPEPNEAIEKARLRLFGYVRNRQGKIEAREERSEIVEQAREKLFGYCRDRAGEIVKPEPTDFEKKWSELQKRLDGSTTEIEEEPSISAETEANIEAERRRIRERLGSKTYKDEKQITKCKWAPNKPCVFSYEAEREALGCSEDQPCRVEVMTLEDVKKLIGDA